MTIIESVFGRELGHLSEEDAARRSRLRFVRSGAELGVFEASRNPTGHILTAWEAYHAYGLDKLEEAREYGSAILIHPSGIENTLHRRARELGLQHSTVAREADLSPEVVQRAKRLAPDNEIGDLERIGFVLGLDELRLGYRPPATDDDALAVRLKTLRPTQANDANRLSARAVLTFAHAASVIRTQHRLQSWLNLAGYARQFVPEEDYGSTARPAYRIGYALADDARKILGLNNLPIESMKNLVETKLGIPVIQAELPQHIAGATIAVSDADHGDARGIVLNTVGANENVWVRRATLAHELGHLLFDPIQRLDRVRVDTYQANEIDPQSGSIDYVEQRANAFAIAFLAPMKAVQEMTPTPLRPDSIQNVMSTFGISHTAARYHTFNSHYRKFPLPPHQAAVGPSDEQTAAENFTLDWFPIEHTPLVRRGRFSGVVNASFRQGYISDDSAARYMNCTKKEFTDASPIIDDLYSLN